MWNEDDVSNTNILVTVKSLTICVVVIVKIKGAISHPDPDKHSTPLAYLLEQKIH